MTFDLNQKLVHIGFRLSLRSGVKKIKKASAFDLDIEETLLEAAREVPNDSKLLSLILSWVEVHADYVIVEKLMKKVRALDVQDSARVWINAIAIYAAHRGYHKWKRWIEPSAVPVYLYGEEPTKSLIKMRGAISYYEKYGYCFAEGTLRIRERDAYTAKELAEDNVQFRNRLMYGPSWRADIITAIEEGATSPSAVAKLVGCSYEPAHRVFNEYMIAKGKTAA